MTRIFTTGTLTPQQFQEAQEQDPTCQDIEANPREHPRFQRKQCVWFNENDDETLVPYEFKGIFERNTTKHPES